MLGVSCPPQSEHFLKGGCLQCEALIRYRSRSARPRR